MIHEKYLIYGLACGALNTKELRRDNKSSVDLPPDPGFYNFKVNVVFSMLLPHSIKAIRYNLHCLLFDL